MNTGKPSSFEEATSFRNTLEEEGKKLVFTNGCFDLLHVGHVRYLQEARELGDALVVAINSDSSVKKLKGEHRPINNANDRAELLLALECVDSVVIFEGERATQAINYIAPHIYAKGGDYTIESLNPEERSALENSNTEIKILSLVPEKSTSATIKKMNRGQENQLPKIAVLGSGSGTNFDAILESVKSNELNAEISLVISDNHDALILEKAKNEGINNAYVDPGEQGLSLSAEKEIRDRLLAAQVDLVVLAGFMKVFNGPVLETFPGKVINIHPSLLPKFKGTKAWVQALEANEKVTGCTVHRVVKEIDSGDIIAQAEVTIDDNETEESLYFKIQKSEHELYPKELQKLLSRSS